MLLELVRRERIINIPNLLTVMRIALLPLICRRFFLKDLGGAMNVYVISMLTDVVDGWVARKTNQVTTIGKLLDPIADKVSTITLLTLFVIDGQIPLWLLLLESAKEAAMVAGGWIAFKNGIVVYALPIGKITTVVFFLSMVLRFNGFKQSADIWLGMAVMLSMIAFVWYSLDLAQKLKRNSTDSAE